MYTAKPSTFSGPVMVEWLEHDSRVMQTVSTLYFMDSKEDIWVAPSGSVIDGASIPKAFWWLIGSPFIGNYRRASVIHDVYCKTKSKPAQKVHNVFKEMMLADGVPRMKAWIMFQAVDKFGPRW